MVSVPWVMTMRASGAAAQRSRMASRSRPVICRLSIIRRVSTSTSRRHRPRRSMSRTWVSLKKSSPVSSLYSLSKVPPVTKMRMGVLMEATGYSHYSAVSLGYPHARHTLALAGGHPRHHLRCWPHLPSSKKGPSRAVAGEARAAAGRAQFHSPEVDLQRDDERLHQDRSRRGRFPGGARLVTRRSQGRDHEDPQQDGADLRPGAKRGGRVLQGGTPAALGRRGANHAEHPGGGAAEARARLHQIVGRGSGHRIGEGGDRAAVELRLRERQRQLDGGILRSAEPSTAHEAGRPARMEDQGAAFETHAGGGREPGIPRRHVGGLA